MWASYEYYISSLCLFHSIYLEVLNLWLDPFPIRRKYGLEDDTIDFIGHALALHSDDSYLDKPAMGFVKKMKVQWTVFFWFI